MVQGEYGEISVLMNTPANVSSNRRNGHRSTLVIHGATDISSFAGSDQEEDVDLDMESSSSVVRPVELMGMKDRHLTRPLTSRALSQYPTLNMDRASRLASRLRGAGSRRVADISVTFGDTSITSDQTRYSDFARENPQDIRNQKLNESFQYSGNIFEAESSYSNSSIGQFSRSDGNPAMGKSMRNFRLEERKRGAGIREIGEISSFQISDSGMTSEYSESIAGRRGFDGPSGSKIAPTAETKYDADPSPAGFDNYSDMDGYEEGSLPAGGQNGHPYYDNDDSDLYVGSDLDNLPDFNPPQEANLFISENEESYTGQPASTSIPQKRSSTASGRSEKRRRASREIQDNISELSDENDDDQNYTVIVNKVPTDQGGTSSLSAVDVIAHAVSSLLSQAVRKEQYPPEHKDWLKEVLNEFIQEVTRRFTALSDVVDINRALHKAAQRSSNARNRLRVRLLNIRQRRQSIKDEIYRARQEHLTNMREKLALKGLSQFADSAKSTPLETPPFSKPNLEVGLSRIEPLYGQYGMLKRVAELNQRLQELISSLESDKP